MKPNNIAAFHTPPRPECGRYDLHNPEMWTVTATAKPGKLPAFTADNYAAARICNTVCPVLAACRLRAITAPPEKKPRGFIQGGLYFDERAQPHKMPDPPPPQPTPQTGYIDRIREIEQQLTAIGHYNTRQTTKTAQRQPLIEQRRQAIQAARKKGKIPTKHLAAELGYTTSFIYKQTTEKRANS